MSAPETECLATEAAELYAGDSGTLPFDTRRTLCQLLVGPYLDAERHALLWRVLERDEAVLRARLSELFLELVIDHELRAAFVRQADTGDLQAPILLRSSPLTFIDSVLLLCLRQRLAESDLQDQRAVIEEAELQEQLSVYQRITATDAAGFGKRVAASIEKMKKNSVLQKLRGSEQRYEIAPTLKLLFSAEQVHALLQNYRARLAIDADVAGDDEDDA
ncbi:DUF4194 domain-containing protein [Pseudomarimonas arenosa]|uniref:DUF4194 domain-containing protein n=1 Tax=Pseudomarimonas arenosa TaxID=2774145 RepID=A0AAW3ZNY1_9GAMM|nr:DUF4194 domain-containing protein [Pseudomarimonas arenosa]MBD8527821.1 DUF4194 domain-containing protein [Pseudomarimonas arenosa]